MPQVSAPELDKLVTQFNTPDFISLDPISIPHRFEVKQDIEISGFIAAAFAWGQRTTIINKANDFLARMDNHPLDFVLNFKPADLQVFQSFKHRTFNGDDAISLLYFFQSIYKAHASLEHFFINDDANVIQRGLTKMNEQFKSLPSTLKRSHKHVSSPIKNSACKRLNMYLRWMVRNDNKGVDFGIWQEVSPSALIIPLDLHVVRSAIHLGLMDSEKANWKTAVELTEKLRQFDKEDPVKYDFALFNYSLMQLGKR